MPTKALALPLWKPLARKMFAIWGIKPTGLTGRHGGMKLVALEPSPIRSLLRERIAPRSRWRRSPCCA
jgi:hypothetical protein